ncbi:heme-binding protein [Chloroflexota bacterium]
MNQKSVLGKEDAERAVRAIMDEASKEPERPVSVAVVDDKGDLLYFVRCNILDRGALLATYMPVQKAYTAARMGVDTRSFQEMFKNRGWDIAWFGDSKLTLLPGGVPVITAEGTVIGAVGVGGRKVEEDQALAEIGVKAIGV